MSDYGTAKDLLSKATAKRYADVDTPYGRYRVRNLTAGELLQITSGNTDDAPLRYIQLCAVDGDGHRIFGDGPEVLDSLRKLDAGVLSAFNQAIESLSGGQAGNVSPTQGD